MQQPKLMIAMKTNCCYGLVAFMEIGRQHMVSALIAETYWKSNVAVRETHPSL